MSTVVEQHKLPVAVAHAAASTINNRGYKHNVLEVRDLSVRFSGLVQPFRGLTDLECVTVGALYGNAVESCGRFCPQLRTVRTGAVRTCRQRRHALRSTQRQPAPPA